MVIRLIGGILMNFRRILECREIMEPESGLSIQFGKGKRGWDVMYGTNPIYDIDEDWFRSLS